MTLVTLFISRQMQMYATCFTISSICIPSFAIYATGLLYDDNIRLSI